MPQLESVDPFVSRLSVHDAAFSAAHNLPMLVVGSFHLSTSHASGIGGHRAPMTPEDLAKIYVSTRF